jgi:hypothetical protein
MRTETKERLSRWTLAILLVVTLLAGAVCLSLNSGCTVEKFVLVEINMPPKQVAADSVSIPAENGEANELELTPVEREISNMLGG